MCSMCLFLFVCGRLNCFKFIAPGLNVSLQFVPPSLVSIEEDEEDCGNTNTVDALRQIQLLLFDKYSCYSLTNTVSTIRQIQPILFDKYKF